MTASNLAVTAEKQQEGQQEETFQSGQVFTIVGAHFVHDTFSAFVPPLLPLVIEKLSMSLTMVGWLNAFMQLPAILNPFIGYLADKISLRYFVIFAPAATATLIGLMGMAPSYGALVVLFLMIGLSTAAFHAPTPAMIARVSAKRMGLGMSLYMAAGELGRTVGPMVAVAGVSTWGLEGIYRLIAIGWGASLILLWRFRNMDGAEQRRPAGGLREALPRMGKFFLPMVAVLLARAFISVSLSTYLPTFMSFEGASLAMAGISLSVLEAAGVAGALLSGTISDRFGRKPVLVAAFSLSALLMFAFLQLDRLEGWLMIVTLLLLGFFALSPQPVLLAMVQDHLPEHRATANGIYMSINFLVRSLVLVLIGMAGDAWGLRSSYLISAVFAALAVVPILFLPTSEQVPEAA